MEDLGIMLYGYEKKDALIITRAVESILNNKITLISGSGKEDLIIEDILGDETYDIYEDKEVKALMFLGFTDSQINAILEGFPPSDKAARPIFCGLTENNIAWTLGKLLEHLLEEQRYWRDKAKK